jgi:hypothetical protein
MNSGIDLDLLMILTSDIEVTDEEMDELFEYLGGRQTFLPADGDERTLEVAA